MKVVKKVLIAIVVIIAALIAGYYAFPEKSSRLYDGCSQK